MSRSGADAYVYAKEIVMSDFEDATNHDIFKKIRKDFDAKSVATPDQEIRHMMNDLMAKAIEQIKASG